MIDRVVTDLDTQERLLDAAEAVFAGGDIASTSLRSIMRSANVNPAAVHYHYGSKDQLVAAVFQRLLEPIQQRRIELLEELENDSRSTEVEALVDALIRPDFEVALDVNHRNAGSARIVGLLYSRPPSYAIPQLEASFGRVARRYIGPLQAAIPHLGREEISWRIRWVVFAVLGSILSDVGQDLDARSAERLITRIVATTSAALKAPEEEPAT